MMQYSPINVSGITAVRDSGLGNGYQSRPRRVITLQRVRGELAQSTGP